MNETIGLQVGISFTKDSKGFNGQVVVDGHKNGIKGS